MFPPPAALMWPEAKKEYLGQDRRAMRVVTVLNQPALTLKAMEGTFLFEGRLDGRALTGTWRQEAGQLHGTWSALPVDKTPAERRSPALAVLREYRRLADGSRCYSSDPQAPAGCDLTGRPLCRVWKVPGSVLALDWKAKPVADNSQ